MLTARNRTWKCPVCNKDSRKFVIDSEQQDLVNKYSDGTNIPSEITFLKNGTLQIKESVENEDDEASTDKNKTKRIAK